MSGAALLAALSVLAGAGAIRELVGDHGEEVRERLGHRLRRLQRSGDGVARAGVALGLAGRIRRAGLDGSVGQGAVLAVKAGGSAVGISVWAATASSLPARLSLLLLAAWVCGGFLALDLVLERIARERARALRAGLADGLDLIALEVGSGVAIPRALATIASGGDGPLADEMARAVAAIESGEPTAEVLSALGAQAAVDELALAGRALARSYHLGAPVGDELRAQAAAIRREHARAVREAADRAAPKIQLVVALVLVPAVLLIIAAALIAHADSLLLGI